MPRIKIESAIPVERGAASRMITAVMDAVAASLRLLPDDRTISFMAYEPGFFTMKPPCTLFIEICLFAGRTKETKKLLYRSILDNLRTECGISPETVMILLNEQPKENWGLRGGIPGDEIEFGYSIGI